MEKAKRNKNKTVEEQESIRNAEKFVQWLKSIGAISASEQREKIESKLKGLTPNEVFKLVKTI